MAPGQRQDLTRVALQQAQKSAEALFETKSIADIKKVEHQTRRDIDGKKLQLRQTVGQSYHELITSADMIKNMADDCKNVVDDLSNIRGVFADLAKALTTTRATPAAQQQGMSDAQLELYAIGSRVKFLVDTPEALWGLLDSKQPLVAARRLRAAMLVHTRLRAERARALSRQFPLLRNRWAATTSKQRDILACANDMLQSTNRMDKMAEAVTAVCLVEGLTSEAALSHFLEQRKTAIATFTAKLSLEPPSTPAAPSTPARTPTPTSTAALMHHAQDTAAMIQNVLFHAVLLFGDDDPLDYLMSHTGGGSPGAGAAARTLWNSKSINPRNTAHMSQWVMPGQPLVQQALSADSHASAELLFDPLPGTDVDAQSEVQAWDAHLAEQLTRMAAVPPEKLRSVCTAWLASLPRAAPHLLSSASSCADLAAVAAAVRAALPAWTPPPPGSAAGAAAAAVSNAGASAGGGAVAALAWPAIAAVALGRGADIWEAVFEPCMLTRADALATAALEAATLNVRRVLEECRIAATSAAEPAGAGSASAWAGARSAAPWRARVSEARAALDTAVCGVLTDSIHLLPAADSGQVRTRVEERRADAIEKRVHEACVSCMMELAADLQQLFSKVPASVDARVVEELLLIGRMANEVAHCSSALPLALAPLSAWPAVSASPSSASLLAPAASRPLRGAPAAAAAARMRSMRERLDSVAGGAFAAWAQWAAAALGERLAAAMLQEAALTATSKPKRWRKCVMDSLSASTAAELGEVSFQLPAESLSATLALLLASARELQRAGGPQLPPLARQCLAVELQGVAVKTISRLIATPSPLGTAAITEPGVIQLLFDTHLLSCALGDAAVPNSITPPTGGATAPTVKAAETAHAAHRDLELQLVGRLDPIDWATYEKYLKGLVRESLSRKALLIGLLVATSPAQEVDAGNSAARAKHGSEDDAFLEATPACARLPLLPISMPHIDSAAIAAQAPAAGAAGLASAAASSSAPARLAAHISGAACAGAPARPATAAAAAGSGLAAAAQPADLCAAYSFSTLTLSKPLDAFADGGTLMGDLAGVQAAVDADGGVAGAAMATFESLGAKISGSAGSAFGGVGLNVTAVQEQLGQFGGSFSSVLGQPSGANSSSFFNSSFFGSAFRSGTGAKQ